MPYNVEIIADSLAPSNKRLVTYVLRMARYTLAELNTHRQLSRSASSSRAIPIRKLIGQVIKDPVVPVWWGKNQPGMSAQTELTGIRKWLAKRVWFGGRWLAILVALTLNFLKVHKQLANRVLEPWLYVSVIVSGTEWDNFFNLRTQPNVQPEFRYIAQWMKRLYDEHKPRHVQRGDWHLPFITDQEYWTINTHQLTKISAARCARVSYLNHEGKLDYDKDLALQAKLAQDKHFSPFEHVAQAVDYECKSGNFVGWCQYRKLLAGG